MTNEHKILILGGGFAGVRAALTLSAARLPDAKIILVSDKPHFEYHPALYRLVAGHSPLEVCIPLSQIFAGKNVEVLEDKIISVSLKDRTAASGSDVTYRFDYLILALGSETSYFNIPGLKERSFGMKSITEALRLKRHLHEMFEIKSEDALEKVKNAHFVVVGGGATGVELAGELAVYIDRLAAQHQFDASFVTIDLIEAAPRLVPMMPPEFSAALERRLRSLGVNIFLNRALMKEEVDEVLLKDMDMKTKTVIWTAGVKTNELYGQIAGLPLDKKGRVAVNEDLTVPGLSNVFVVGDGAATAFSGMAQTAVNDASYAAAAIAARIQNRRIEPYVPKRPSYAIPVGPGWAAVIFAGFRIYGLLGWWLRRAADLRFFLSILPFSKALTVFRDQKTLVESCPICCPE